MNTRWTNLRGTPASGSLAQGPMDAHLPQTGLKVRITLTSAAQNHVLRFGLNPRLALLIEQAPRLHGALVTGDRVALSEAPTQDLYVLRRRMVVEVREAVLEIILDFMPIG